MDSNPGQRSGPPWGHEAEAERRRTEEARRCDEECLERTLAESEARAQEEARCRAEERENYSRQDHNQVN